MAAPLPVFTLGPHGGAGDVPCGQVSKTALAVVEKCLREGGEMLKGGTKAIEVVQFVVRTMEDSGEFNAGAVTDSSGGRNFLPQSWTVQSIREPP